MGQKISSFRFFDICGPICQHFCPRVSFLTFAALEYAQKSDIARSNQLLLLTDMLITLRDLFDVGDKMKILEGYIDVSDGCWRQNVLVTSFRCW